MSLTEFTDSKYLVPPEEVGKPLSQEEMLELLKARRENQDAYEGFLRFSKAREVMESLRLENSLIGAEILERKEQPDASEIKLELRWPVKSGVVEGEHPFGLSANKTKSYPATYNYVTVNFNRVQTRWTPDDGSEVAWTVSIEGERLESNLWAAGSLQPWEVEEAIKRAFSNPKTKDFESPIESQQGERG